MDCGPVSEISLAELERLIIRARERGDECLAVLLEGISMYISLGREWELLEAMRNFERDVRPAVEGTPSPEELLRLYEREDKTGPS